MNLKKKFIIYFLILCFIGFVGVSSAARPALAASHWFTVVPTPPNAGENAAYHIYGGISEFSHVNMLSIIFPWTGFKYNNVNPRTVVVNDVYAKSVTMTAIPDVGTNRTNLRMNIVLGKEINYNETIDIKISKDAGIINPKDPRPCYSITVYLYSYGSELGSIGSSLYEITQSRVSSVTVNAEPSVIGMEAAYTISFVTGVNGNLFANQNDILIKFPKGTVLPSFIPQGAVKVNDQVSKGVYRDSNSPDVLDIYVPENIGTLTPVTVTISKSLGIVNTRNAGDNYVYVSTYKEPEWVKSAPFVLFPPAVRNLKVSASSDIVASDVYMKFDFVPSPVGYLKTGENIYVEFPESFNFKGGSISPDSVLVNNKPALKVTLDGNVLTVQTPLNLYPNKKAELFVKSEAGIVLPKTPGNYKIKVYTDSDKTISSTDFKVLPSTIEDLTFTPEYTGINLNSAYWLKFKTGNVGALTAGQDYIYIKFDPAFQMPQTVPPDSVKVNGTSANNVSVDAYKVISVEVPVDVSPLSEVSVEISDKAGIKNPSEIGKYGVTVYTSREKTPVASNVVLFKELPVVNFSVTPKQPDGSNGVYITSPEIQLYTPNGTEIYYKLDKGNFEKYNGEKITIQNGKHVLFAYAVDSEGNKGAVESKTFIVDTAPPVITFDQGKGNLYVNTNPAVISGKVNEQLSVLKINGDEVKVNPDLTFSFTMNLEGEQTPLAVYARDTAGRSVALVMMVYLDQSPPQIEMLSPKQPSVTTSQSTFDISFRVTDNEPLKDCRVTLNGQPVEAESDGLFNYTADLQDGENVFDISATDLAGNVASKEIVVNKVNQIVVKLQIGNDTASVNGNTVKLDSPPVIIKNKTFVPLRFVSEAFGAKIKWDGALKVITINYDFHSIQLQVGSSSVLVDGEIKKLVAPPVIKNNRTLVPLRFIAETFGASVQWDASTKTITITFTP